MFHRILVAIDGEPTVAHPVLAEAWAIAHSGRAALNIIQVMPPFNAVSTAPMPVTGTFSSVNPRAVTAYIEHWQKQEQAIHTRLQTLVAAIEADGLNAEATFAIGEPGREICAAAQAWDADLIVLGRRGLGGLGQLLLGSVSSYVMHRARCAVLIVQGKTPGQPGE